MEITMQLVWDYLEICKDRKKLDAKTVKAYRIDLRQFVKYTAVKKKHFSRDGVLSYLRDMHQKYKPRTVKRKIASLRAFSKYLINEKNFRRNPFAYCDTSVRIPESLPRTITLHTAKKLLKTVHEERKYNLTALRDAAMIEVLFATGIRVTELCDLKMQDVNLLDGIIQVCGKGKKERLIQVTNKEVLGILRQYVKEFKPDMNGTFFLNQRRKRISDQSVRLMLRKYTKKINHPTRITPHMFRHTLATLLMEADVDTRYIQQLLGHASILTTQIYTHVSGTKQREIMATKHPRNLISIAALCA